MSLDLIGTGVNLLGSVLGAGSAQQGTQANLALQREGLAEQKRVFDIGQENLQPWQQAGERGLAEYESRLGAGGPQWGGFSAADMQEDPGYQFRLGQGFQGLERMAARGGERFSGKLGAGLMDYGQRMGSQEFGAARGRSLQDYQIGRGEYTQGLDRYQGLAGMGQRAATGMASLGSQYGSTAASMYGQMGQTAQRGYEAQAAGYLGGASAISGGLAGMQYQQNFDRYINQGAQPAGSGGYP